MQYQISPEFATRCIQLAAKYCLLYASDIRHDLNYIESRINDRNRPNTFWYCIGFREMGCDHQAYIMNSPETAYSIGIIYKNTLQPWGFDEEFKTVSHDELVKFCKSHFDESGKQLEE